MDQKNHLWIWSEYIVSTFALKVAYYIWYGKEASLTELEQKKLNENATVICKGNEPNAFKALFPSWKVRTLFYLNFFQEFDGEEIEESQTLTNLLYKRTKYRSIEELRLRRLPKGCDTKHLENYLSDYDFEHLFLRSRLEYSALPRWRQISLKKELDLF